MIKYVKKINFREYNTLGVMFEKNFGKVPLYKSRERKFPDWKHFYAEIIFFLIQKSLNQKII
jgi:hypothetical protein